MKINQEFFEFIKPVLEKIKERLNDEFVIFGSTPLYLLGILKFNRNEGFHDLDIIVKNESSIPEEAEVIYYQGNEDQKLHKMYIDNFEIDFGGRWPSTAEYFEASFVDPIEVEGFKFVNLDVVKKWKEWQDRPKDRIHLEKIANYQKKNSPK